MRVSCDNRAKQPSILQVCGNLGLGGMEMHVADLARWFKTEDITVSTCCKTGGWLARQLSGDESTYTLPLQRHFDFRSRKGLALLLDEINPDIVHAHGPVAFGVAVGVVKPPTKLVASVHGNWGLDRRLGRADAVIAVCEFLKNRLRGCVRDESKLNVIYNGIDVSAFTDYQGSRPTFREEFKLGERPIVLSVGRLVACKGLDVLINAAGRVLKSIPSAVFVIVGGETKYADYLHKLCATYGISDSVIFTGRRDDIPRILHDADVFVQASRMDATTLTLMEAMAAGKPVIGASSGGIPEVITEGSGLLFESENDAELTESICRLLGDASLRDELARAGHERAISMFSKERMLRDLMELYKRLMP